MVSCSTSTPAEIAHLLFSTSCSQLFRKLEDKDFAEDANASVAQPGQHPKQSSVSTRKDSGTSRYRKRRKLVQSNEALDESDEEDLAGLANVTILPKLPASKGSNSRVITCDRLRWDPSLHSYRRQQAARESAQKGYHIRFQPFQLEYEESKRSIESVFNITTNTFKNSVWNRAHYGNPDFNPQEWRPDDGQPFYGRTGGKRRR
jgi:hypothetical protein